MSALVNAVPALGPLCAILLSRVAEQSGRRILPEFQQPTVREIRNYPIPLYCAWMRAGFGAPSVPGSQLRRCKLLSGTQDEWTPESIVEQAVQTLQLDRSNLHWCLSRDHHPHLPKRDQPEEAARNVAQIINLINVLLRDVSVDSSLESEEARTVTS